MATVTTGGRYAKIVTLALTATDDTQVGFTESINTLIIKCRTGVDLQVRSSRNSPDYFTVPSGQSLTLDILGNINSLGVVDPLNIWIRSATGSIVAEVLALYGN